MDKKITITREDVKGVLGFMAQLGTAVCVGGLMGAVCPRNKIWRFCAGLGSGALSVRLMKPVQEGVDDWVDNLCTLLGLVKEHVEVETSYEEEE